MQNEDTAFYCSDNSKSTSKKFEIIFLGMSQSSLLEYQLNFGVTTVSLSKHT